MAEPEVTIDALYNKIFNLFYKTRLTPDFHITLTVKEVVFLLKYLDWQKDILKSD